MPREASLLKIGERLKLTENRPRTAIAEGLSGTVTRTARTETDSDWNTFHEQITAGKRQAYTRTKVDLDRVTVWRSTDAPRRTSR